MGIISSIIIVSTAVGLGVGFGITPRRTPPNKRDPLGTNDGRLSWSTQNVATKHASVEGDDVTEKDISVFLPFSMDVTDEQLARKAVTYKESDIFEHSSEAKDPLLKVDIGDDITPYCVDVQNLMLTNNFNHEGIVLVFGGQDGTLAHYYLNSSEHKEEASEVVLVLPGSANTESGRPAVSLMNAVDNLKDMPVSIATGNYTTVASTLYYLHTNSLLKYFTTVHLHEGIIADDAAIILEYCWRMLLPGGDIIIDFYQDPDEPTDNIHAYSPHTARRGVNAFLLLHSGEWEHTPYEVVNKKILSIRRKSNNILMAGTPTKPLAVIPPYWSPQGLWNRYISIGYPQ